MLALGDWAAADRLLGQNPGVVNPGGASFGVLHLMAKRNNVAAVRWLLEHKADPNALWPHWDAKVTPLHMATMEHHPDIVRALLDAGADPSIRDSKFDSDAIGWAEFFRRTDIVQMLRDSKEEK
jgi:ankyrin repeat protein